MPTSPPPQPVPAPAGSRPVAGHRSTSGSGSGGLAAPRSVAGPSRLGTSPASYGAMTGISFADGGGFSFETRNGVPPPGNMDGGYPTSYGSKFYGVVYDPPSLGRVFSTSITMDVGSFPSSSSAFNLHNSSGSYRRSYADAAARRRREAPNLSTSFSAMSVSGMSLGTSYSKSQVHHLMASRPKSDAELQGSYECCGQTHPNLHALLEHVEETHPYPADEMPPAAAAPAAVPHAQPQMHLGFSPQVLAMDMELDGIEEGIEQSGTESTRSSLSPPVVPGYPLPTSGTSPAPLSISDILTSPPDGAFVSLPNPLLESALASTVAKKANGTASATPSLTGSSRPDGSTSSSPPDVTLTTPNTSSRPSPVFAPPKLTQRSFLSQPANKNSDAKRYDHAFQASETGKTGTSAPKAVAPGQLFASVVTGLGIPTNPASQAQTDKPALPGQGPPVPATDGAAPAPGNAAPASGTDQSAAAPAAAGANVAKPADPVLPQPSLFTTHKPWRCPNPGCNKAYKQSNGLKYHQLKGQCDFAISDAVELGLSAQEAEQRSRPYVCAVGAGCTKRYRQLNGLKYHYLNSGPHGMFGFRMLQDGTHPEQGNIPAPKKPAAPFNAPRPTGPTGPPPPPSSTGTGPMSASALALGGAARASAIRGPAASTTISHQQQVPRPGASAAPYAVPNRAAPGLPRMGVFPTSSTGAAGAGTQIGAQSGVGQSRPLGVGINGVKTNPRPVPPPVQRGRDAVLFSAVRADGDR